MPVNIIGTKAFKNRTFFPNYFSSLAFKQKCNTCILNKIEKTETRRIQPIGPIIIYRHYKYFDIFLYRYLFIWIDTEDSLI